MADRQAMHFDSIRHRIEDYRDQVDKWQRDHHLAMYCMEFELHLQHGLSLLSQLHHADEKVRLKVCRGEAEYDPQLDEALREHYRWWLKPCDKVLDEIDALEQEGFQVEHAEEFRAACREVRGILTNDSEFFVEDDLAPLKDEAIDEHRAGATGLTRRRWLDWEISRCR